MRTTKTAGIMKVMLGLCLAVLVSVGFAGTAGAQSTDATCLERFTNNGELDVTGYAGCVAGATETAPGGGSASGGATQGGTNLPATGVDSNSLSRALVVGAVLVVLGGAAVAGSLQARRTAGADA